ncbi:MAG: hypothetical protein RIM72_00565 [Alphaproteobacteria bacterium]
MPPATMKPGRRAEIFVELPKDPPELVDDLPDDDWDAWLAGAKLCPGFTNAEGDHGA